MRYLLIALVFLFGCKQKHIENTPFKVNTNGVISKIKPVNQYCGGVTCVTNKDGYPICAVKCEDEYVYIFNAKKIKDQ